MSETGQNIAEQYIETPIGSLKEHKFLHHTQETQAYQVLCKKSLGHKPDFRYLVEVYIDNYIGLTSATSQEHLDHVANVIMCGIHDIFPAYSVDTEDPISFKKLIKREGSWDVIKEILGFVFHGGKHTMWLADGKQDALIALLKHCPQRERMHTLGSFSKNLAPSLIKLGTLSCPSRLVEASCHYFIAFLVKKHWWFSFAAMHSSGQLSRNAAFSFMSQYPCPQNAAAF